MLSEKTRNHAEGLIRPGFFKIKFTKGGPWIPAVIYRPCPIEMDVDDNPWRWCDRWPQLHAMCNSDSFGHLLEEIDPYRVWVGGTEIELWEFQHWMAVRRHIRLYEPDAIDADPRRRIDLSKAAPRGPRPR